MITIKKFVSILLLSIILLTGCSKNISDKEPLQNESPYLISKSNAMYGIWFSYLDFDDFLRGLDKASFEARMNEVIGNCKKIGLNTIILHVRSHGDAYYFSDLFPASSHLSGTLDKAMDYDALALITYMCHKNGISVHAWINPFRLQSESEIKTLSDSYLIKQWYNDKNGTYVVNVNGRYFLNCAYSEVRKFICGGIAEVVKNYDIDGVQFDDYFYPTTDASFDKTAFEESKSTDLSQFRLDSVNELIKSVYSTIKEIKPQVPFGVSPQGNINNNYTSQYADVKRWCSEEGYIDYIVPQIYYGFENKTSPFEATANAWQETLTNKKVKFVGGLAAYKIGKTDALAGDENAQREWINADGIIARQIKILKNQKNFGGIILFRYGTLINPPQDLRNAVEAEVIKIMNETG